MIIRAASEADSKGLAKVHVDSWKTTYRGLVPDSYLDGLTYDRSAERWQRNFTNYPDNHVFAAENDSGIIVGFASGGRNRDVDVLFDAELYAIYILEEEQQRGLGRALTKAFAKAIVETNGYESMVVWVLAGNTRARRFYEKMGGTLVSGKQITIGGVSLDEVAYGWPDVATTIVNGR